MKGTEAMDKGIARLLHLALHLGSGKPLTTAMIRERFGVSKATAKRDLDRLECLLPVTVEEVPVPAKYPQKVLRLEASRADYLSRIRLCAA